MRFINALMITVVFSSCLHKTPEVYFFKTNNFILADTTLSPKDFLDFSENCASYQILYIGPKRDTIRVGERFRQKFEFDFDAHHGKVFSERTLKVFVDTAVITNSRVNYYSWIQEKIIEDSSKNYSSFLLTVQNISDSVINMGRTRSLFFMCREAKDRKGNWVTIQKKLSDVGLCLSNQPRIVLRQNEIIISKVKRYKGSFVTDCRLVFGYKNNKVFSNVFRDSIDERMFSADMSTQLGPYIPVHLKS